MTTHRVYCESVKDYRAQSVRRMNDAQRAYNGLRDKSTTYAREIAELLALHARVTEVWLTAPDDIQANTTGEAALPAKEDA